jgi:hypothetical protein
LGWRIANEIERLCENLVRTIYRGKKIQDAEEEVG